jgi:tetratricopeptide (TPR) repeat protein
MSRRKLLIRLSIMAAAVVVSVLLLEIILRITGLGMPPGRLVLTKDGLMPRPTQGPELFDEAQFPIPIKAEARRIFFFGGSSTQGFPYPEHSWPSICARALQGKKESGNRNPEPVNLGMLQGSLREARLLLEELIEFGVRPGAVVVHSANNELYYNRVRILDEHHHPTKQRLKGLRTISRIADVIYQSVGSQVPSEPEKLRDLYPLSEPNRQLLLQEYESDLRKIVRLCRQHKIPLVLTTIPINRDYWAPHFARHPIPAPGSAVVAAAREKALEGTEHFYKNNLAEAREAFEAALSTLPTDPYCHFYLGRILLAGGQTEQALKHLELAIRYDTFRPVRATPTHNEIIRQVAESENLPLIDFDRLLLDKHGIAGKKLFIDNCHGRPDTYIEMGILLAQVFIEKKLMPGLPLAVGDLSEILNADRSISEESLKRVRALVEPLQDEGSAFLKEWESGMRNDEIPNDEARMMKAGSARGNDE